MDLKNRRELGDSVTTRGSGIRSLVLWTYVSRLGRFGEASRTTIALSSRGSKKVDWDSEHASAAPAGPPPTMQTSGVRIVEKWRRPEFTRLVVALLIY